MISLLPPSQDEKHEELDNSLADARKALKEAQEQLSEMRQKIAELKTYKVAPNG